MKLHDQHKINTVTITKDISKRMVNTVRAPIITRGLYTFDPIFEGKNGFLRRFFHKIRTLCKISIHYSRVVYNQEPFMMARVQ